MRRLIIAVIFLVMSLGVFVAWEAVSFFNYRSSGEPTMVLVDVPPGRSFAAVASELTENGLIDNPQYFRIYARLSGGASGLKVGEYALNSAMGPREILSILTSGKSYARTLTIPEGHNMYEVASLLEVKRLGTKEEFLKMFKDKVLIKSLLGEEIYSLEGYLFPETYHFTKYTDRREIVSAMVKNFLYVFDQVKEPDSKFSRHEVVTLASVIEKETGAPDERPLISSVFHNRLEKGMRLQSDPTILYGILDQTGVMKKNITRKDLTSFNRYSTYKVKGLPYGPIANPGKESLRAVFKPVKSDYIFFVSRNDGTHVFSETLKEHNAAVRKFQIDSRARQGKSWRDLKTKRPAQ